jgi:hypothetical protein
MLDKIQGNKYNSVAVNVQINVSDLGLWGVFVLPIPGNLDWRLMPMI